MRRAAPYLVAMSLAAGSAAATDAEQLARDASDWLLSGQGLPRDYRVLLLQMDSADRLLAIAYLRRVGLLTDRPWTVEDVLRPAQPQTELAK
ncbi:hypothetical protein E4L95_05600 [Paracoccus liaowanqingii]|uniref:Uncharacterized protein n=1 Tax=Paracoccus liaowanqingii TaxID=2560053 RepID=A0A4Z1CQE8_9RHOB|nr:hypothetical protein [Paracoccus liaowanqingii]TGN67263.1 hypothetical protein E4L95_05600 [Paracoccus liaowanqingii]